MRGERIQIPLKAGHHRPASETPAFRWHADHGLTSLNIERWLGNFVIFQGIQTSIAKKPYILVNFQGGVEGLDPVPPLDPSMICQECICIYAIDISRQHFLDQNISRIRVKITSIQMVLFS